MMRTTSARQGLGCLMRCNLDGWLALRAAVLDLMRIAYRAHDKRELDKLPLWPETP